MLDGMMPREVKVWGFTVRISSSGRHKWPEGLRAKAVEHVLSGAGIRETAEEIGANKSLVAHWVKKAEEAQSEQTFVELIAPGARKTEAPSSAGEPLGTNDGFCRIRCCDTAIEISPGYPVEHLTEILRAVRNAV